MLAMFLLPFSCLFTQQGQDYGPMPWWVWLLIFVITLFFIWLLFLWKPKIKRPKDYDETRGEAIESTSINIKQAAATEIEGRALYEKAEKILEGPDALEIIEVNEVDLDGVEGPERVETTRTITAEEDGVTVTKVTETVASQLDGLGVVEVKETLSADTDDVDVKRVTQITSTEGEDIDLVRKTESFEIDSEKIDIAEVVDTVMDEAIGVGNVQVSKGIYDEEKGVGVIDNMEADILAADALSATLASGDQRSGDLPAAKMNKPDDLLIVKGIGPKINAVLKSAGITSFAQLAETSPEKLKDLITAAGIQLGETSSWPEQARLAGLGLWDELKTLQDKVKVGRL